MSTVKKARSCQIPSGPQHLRHGFLWTAVTVTAALGLILPAITAEAAGWHTRAPVPNGDYGPSARGGDGRIYVFVGGSLSLNAYTPSTNSWATAAGDPVDRGGFAVAEGSSGAILVVGGEDSSGNVLATAEFYSPRHNTWSSVAPMPTPRADLALTFAGGKFYALGGENMFGGVLDNVEAYNPSTNTWAEEAALPVATCYLGAVTGPDGRIYAIGGDATLCEEPGDGDSNQVDAYSVATNTWTAVAPIPADHGRLGRDAFGYTLGSNGKIYVIGGQEVGSDPGFLTRSVLEYSTSTNTWASVTSLPALQGFGSSAATGSGAHGLVYSIGGVRDPSAMLSFSG